MKKIEWLKTDMERIKRELSIPWLKEFANDCEPEEDWHFVAGEDELCELIGDDHPEFDCDFWEGRQFSRDAKIILAECEKYFNTRKKKYWQAIKKAERDLLA